MAEYRCRPLIVDGQIAAMVHGGPMTQEDRQCMTLLVRAVVRQMEQEDVTQRWSRWETALRNVRLRRCRYRPLRLPIDGVAYRRRTLARRRRG